MPFKWTPEAETKLLLGAVKYCDAKPSAEFYDQIAAAIGPEVNANACNQKFLKLKRECDMVLSAADDTADAATPASTKKPAKKTPSSSGRKRKGAADDTDNAESTPSKKTTKAKTKSKEDAAADASDADETAATPSKITKLKLKVKANDKANDSDDKPAEDSNNDVSTEAAGLSAIAAAALDEEEEV